MDSLKKILILEEMYFSDQLSIDKFISAKAEFLLMDDAKNALLNALETQQVGLVDLALEFIEKNDFDSIFIKKCTPLLFDISIDGSTRVMSIANNLLEKKLEEDKFIYIFFETYLKNNFQKYLQGDGDFYFRRLLSTLISLKYFELVMIAINFCKNHSDPDIQQVEYDVQKELHLALETTKQKTTVTLKSAVNTGK